ncbi:hypothetical protein BT63DRAFT_484248 [Microthyrium microscopicum]|uniref:COX assembly mitochondrial protein n=1 Tax=Microthyrium microscopicum TaxID=703497 RepID=A0A6A6TWI6_9PEZI|nr:hypothetical protein BT63DRAFT_484248 [Microthyrium microscopicum]
MSQPTPITSQSARRIIQPIPLSSKQESEIRDIYHKAVRSKCSDQIAKFAACAKANVVSVNFTCSSEKLNMNHCLRLHATQEEEDRARAEWFSKLDHRRKEREKEAQDRIENEKKLKDWWGMDDNWNRVRGPEGELLSPKPNGRGKGG